jgi:branched-chain amino acid transport system substrate-binding protein
MKEEGMKKSYLLVGLLVLALAVAVTAVACGSGEETTTTLAATTTVSVVTGPATGEPIKIGLDNSLTGFSAAPGNFLAAGVKVQIEYVNANGGINGRPLELIQYDDASDVPTAIANINKLIQEDQVFATIGPFAQFMQEPARQIAEQTQTPMVGAGPATLDQLKGTQYQWSVMHAAGPPPQADAVDKVIKAAGWKNVLGLADVLTIDQETLDVVVQLSASGGYKFTKMPDSFGLDTQDFQPLLNKIMEQISALSPDAIVLYVNPLGYPALYKGLRSLGVTLPILAGTACANTAIFAMGPEAVDDSYIMDSGGSLNPQALPDSWPVKAVSVDFAQRYQAKYGDQPNFFAALGADMVILLTEAMRQAGEPDKVKVQQALINLKDVKTMEGLVTFTPQATSMGINGQMVEWHLTNGQFELVGTIN